MMTLLSFRPWCLCFPFPLKVCNVSCILRLGAVQEVDCFCICGGAMSYFGYERLKLCAGGFSPKVSAITMCVCQARIIYHMYARMHGCSYNLYVRFSWQEFGDPNIHEATKNGRQWRNPNDGLKRWKKIISDNDPYIYDYLTDCNRRNLPGKQFIWPFPSNN